MRLPKGENAVIDEVKLTEYCLNPNHPRGRHKARVFAAALGLTADNVATLAYGLRAAAKNGDARRGEKDGFGQRYVIDFELQGPGGSARVRSVWIVRAGEAFPRLTSCYVL